MQSPVVFEVWDETEKSQVRYNNYEVNIAFVPLKHYF